MICGPAAEHDRRPTIWWFSVRASIPISPLAQNFSTRKIETIGELELGWRSCESPVIAITGTNGKTTTTELVAQMLNACGQRTIACGNIGKPLCEVVREQAGVRRAHGRSQLVPARDDSELSARASRLAELRARSSRSLSLGLANIARPSCASSNIRRPMMSPSSTRRDDLPHDRARRLTFSAYADARISLADGAIVFRRRSRFCGWPIPNCAARTTSRIDGDARASVCARGLSFEQMVPPLCAYEPRRTAANSSATIAASITSTIRRRPIWMRSRKRSLRKRNRWS